MAATGVGIATAAIRAVHLQSHDIDMYTLRVAQYSGHGTPGLEHSTLRLARARGEHCAWSDGTVVSAPYYVRFSRPVRV